MILKIKTVYGIPGHVCFYKDLTMQNTKSVNPNTFITPTVFFLIVSQL